MRSENAVRREDVGRWHYERDGVRIVSFGENFILSYPVRGYPVVKQLDRSGPAEGIGELSEPSLGLHVWYDRPNRRWSVTYCYLGYAPDVEKDVWHTDTIFLYEDGRGNVQVGYDVAGPGVFKQEVMTVIYILLFAMVLAVFLITLTRGPVIERLFQQSNGKPAAEVLAPVP